MKRGEGSGESIQNVNQKPEDRRTFEDLEVDGRMIKKCK
jgi:hypothetical protein